MGTLMRWLGRGRDSALQRAFGNKDGLEQKSGISPLIALHGLGEASWCEAGYRGLAHEGYARNPVVHRCVRVIADAAASAPLLVYEGSEEMDTHPALALLQNPNPRQSGQEFLDLVYSNLLISGNAYLAASEMQDTPRELFVLRPDRIIPIVDDAGWPMAYDYTVNGTRTRYETGQLKAPFKHLSLFNPLDDIEGLPPLASAHMALDIHNAASRWNKALLDNSARPSGALVYGAGDSANLTDEQFDRLKSELEEGYSGAGRAGRPMLLEGGLDWKQMGFSPRDMDFMEARNGAAREIALAFGVPPMLLGIPGDNTYANYREANLALWRQTVLPLVARVTTSLQNWLGPWWSSAMRIDIDRDAIEALSADREALWKRVNEAGFLTLAEKRLATGYGATTTHVEAGREPSNGDGNAR